MRKPIQIALVTVLVLLVGATALLFTKYRKTSADFVQMKAAEEEARTRYGQTIDAIAEIQDSLNAISLASGTAQLLSQELRAEQKLTEPQGREALDRIAILRASILRSKGMIHQLEANLTKSGMKIAGLQKMIANLKQTVTEKEGLIGELSVRVDSLQTQVTGLVAEVQQTQETVRTRDQAIEEKRRELATVYYIVGKKKELAAAGAIVAKGGVLGIGKTLQPSGNVNQSLLTAMDTDQETVIHTPSARVKVLSAQPTSSYELRLVDGRMELHIIDPKEFRKVKQLVILAA
ncbi:MAG: hypothetical protein AAB113_12020 [Candidatus Eisenbacteria bacterium]